MLSGISIFCFAASYALALLLEAGRPLARNRLPQRSAWILALAGFIAHTLFLGHRANISQASPLSSPFDWYLLAAWTLAGLYVVLTLSRPSMALGIFLLPAVLLLIVVAQFASQEPFAVDRASRFWGNIHGTCLLLGTVTVILGFLAGLMYLLQSYRLKHKLPLSTGFRLPSLEWLQRLNGRALLASVLLIGCGFLSGVILNLIRHRHDSDYVPWSDPLVVITGVMFLYLLAAQLFSVFYRPARAGRKVAYLTMASFLFLALTLAVLLSGRTQHGAPQPAAPEDREKQASLVEFGRSTTQPRGRVAFLPTSRDEAASFPRLANRSWLNRPRGAVSTVRLFETRRPA